MKIILNLILVMVLTGCSLLNTPATPVILTFNSASETPKPGYFKMSKSGGKRSIYVSKEVLLSNTDIKSAHVIKGPYGSQIEIQFTNIGSERFKSVTARNIMKPLAILLDGELLSAPIVREKISGGRAVISGYLTDKAAKRIADGIVKR